MRYSVTTALLLLMSFGCSAATTDPTGTANPAAVNEHLGVMLQLDNLLPASGKWGDLKAEVDQQFQILQSMNVKYTRATILWEQIERTEGVYDWDAADYVVDRANNYGIQLVWILGGTAFYKRADGKNESTDKQYDGRPEDLKNPNGRWPQFVSKIVNRYMASIHYWEVRNEPNLDKFSAAQYAVYLQQAHDQIKAADPQARIIFGGLGGELPQEIKFFEKLVTKFQKAGQSLPFDVANFHVYPGDTVKRTVPEYVKWANQQIDTMLQVTGLTGMPIWITEFDFPAWQKFQPNDPDYNQGEASQVKFVNEMIPLLMSGRPFGKVFYASLLDDYNSGGEFMSTGLIISDNNHSIGAHRKSFDAMVTLLGQ